jgi:hypothetical protein
LICWIRESSSVLKSDDEVGLEQPPVKWLVPCQDSVQIALIEVVWLEKTHRQLTGAAAERPEAAGFEEISSPLCALSATKH